MTPVETRTLAAEKLRIEYPESLPVSRKADEIKAKLGLIKGSLILKNLKEKGEDSNE